MNLNLEDWKKQKESDAKNICLDVRTAEEYKEGNIENSINIDFYKSMDFMKFLDKLDRKSTRLNSSHSQQSRMPSSA